MYSQIDSECTHIYNFIYMIYFIISVLGCANIPQPKNTWMRRQGDNIVIKCNRTGETWSLTCKGMTWVGEYGNCSQGEYYTKYYLPSLHNEASPSTIQFIMAQRVTPCSRCRSVRLFIFKQRGVL